MLYKKSLIIAFTFFVSNGTRTRTAFLIFYVVLMKTVAREGYEQYCACIPVSLTQDQPYCLDLDKLTCRPHSFNNLDCGQEHIITPNQGDCLATLFQSEPYPPCRMVTGEFCDSHPVYRCDETGNPSRCKK